MPALHLGANPQSTPHEPASFAHFRINYFVLPSAADDAKTTSLMLGVQTTQLMLGVAIPARDGAKHLPPQPSCQNFTTLCGAEILTSRRELLGATGIHPSGASGGWVAGPTREASDAP
jgi:hypothetical protein